MSAILNCNKLPTSRVKAPPWKRSPTFVASLRVAVFRRFALSLLSTEKMQDWLCHSVYTYSANSKNAAIVYRATRRIHAQDITQYNTETCIESPEIYVCCNSRPTVSRSVLPFVAAFLSESTHAAPSSPSNLMTVACPAEVEMSLDTTFFFAFWRSWFISLCYGKRSVECGTGS